MEPRFVIGFMGKRRSGKSTCSAALRALYGSSSRADIKYSDPLIDAANFALRNGDLRPIQFGNALVEGAKIVTAQDSKTPENDWRFREGAGADVEFRLRHWLDTKAHPGLRLSRENKDEHRAVLMWLGINLRDLVDSAYWANEIDRRIVVAQDEPLITTSGVRFPEDAKPVTSRGGLIVEVTSARVHSDDDPTNARRSEIKPDTVVHNDGSRAQVNIMMGLMRRDMLGKARAVAPSYRPS